MLSCLLVALAFHVAPTLESSVEDLAADLQHLVRLETPGARRARALELAERKSVSLEAWQAAMQAFGKFEAQEVGSRIERVDLRVGELDEKTEIHLHIPVDYDVERPAPLLLAFHGTGGSGDSMAKMWVEEAERVGMIVVAPSEAGANEGYAFSDRERQAALAALRWARLEFNIDENRIFATGVSRGGHLAWDLALRYPGTLAGIAPMIGSPRIQPRFGQNNMRYLENVLDLPIRDLQGVNDDAGMVFNLKFVFERLEKLGATDAQLFLQEGLGHSFRMSAVDWEKYFTSVRRKPLPSTVRRAVGREDEGRAYWVEVLETQKPIAENFEIPLTSKWKQADDEGQRVIIQEVADSKTGHLEVALTGIGAFEAKASAGIKSFRMLLPERAYEAGKPLDVTFNKKRMRPRPKASNEVLLLEFAERFDREFLPVAEVIIK